MTKAEQLLELVRNTEKTLNNYKAYYYFLLDELETVDKDLFDEYVLEHEMRMKK